MTKTRGKVHEYLGMTLDFSQHQQVRVSKQDNIKSIVSDLPEDMAGVAPTPATNHLFTVNDKNPIQLNIQKENRFHHFFAKLWFLSKHSRPDIQTAVVFLITWVTKPDEDNYKKLAM